MYRNDALNEPLDLLVNAGRRVAERWDSVAPWDEMESALKGLSA